MVSSHKKLANVVGGKTARACDNCIRKRARWYCAADDAFLCQSCDGSVHSANPLARRHERVRLKVASLKLSSLEKPPPPPWHHGFTKKPRTPRGGKHASRQTAKSEESSMSFNPLHLVPEIGSDETTAMESDDQLLYQVPVFDPFAAEFCLSRKSNEVETTPVKQAEVTTPVDADSHNLGSKVMIDLNSFNGLILPSDMELAEFTADVESLLGKGLEEESFAMEGLGLLDCREKDSSESLERVKVEEDDQMQSEIVESEMEMMREPFQLTFDYDSPVWEEKEVKVAVDGGVDGSHSLRHDHTAGMMKKDEDDRVDLINIEKYDDDDENKKNKRILKLDYEGIIAAWDEQRSPWTTGDRPELDPDDCWPECMGGCGIMNHHHSYGDMGMMIGNPAMLDGGREAKVSRYREKRRTRLFSKKIRYEVRKLNAEKRPRMKGRFVKRASTLGFPLPS